MIAALLLLLAAAATAAAEDDVRCLRGLKSSFTDPNGYPNWNFSDTTVGFVCHFDGVSCWNSKENRVFGLTLAYFSLSGPIPSALQYCHNANKLDLSSNSLSGPIPAALCSWLPYLVSLDLSSNKLSGPIPPDLSACQYLNSLILSRNSFSGSIPSSLGLLDRLHDIDLSYNSLSGPIPASFGVFDVERFASNSLSGPIPASLGAESFASNLSLCGRPLSSCGGSKSRTSLIIILAAGILGAAASLLLAYVAWRWCAVSRQPGQPAAAAHWAERLRSSHNRLVPVSLFQKPIVKVKLADLLTATADFHPDHIVAAGSIRTGTAYSAVLPDGSALTVKRLRPCSFSEKQFRSEMARIGQLRHPNLVPLLGFCFVEDERLLIYKHMPTGALSAALRTLDWPSRLRIGVGAARGLAWLHHGFQQPFLHQTFNSTSVLLDDDCEPRITDFGLASLVGSMSSSSAVNSTPFMNGDYGEFGYVAPEYGTNPIASAKGDVYAFGVVLMELATGQKAAEITIDVVGEVFKGNLVDWVSQLSGAGRIRDAIDKSLRGRGHEDKIVQFLNIACGCVVAHPKERPSMSQIYDSLKSIGEDHDSSEHFDEFPLIYGKDDAAVI